jgi:hypothetical protein
MSTATDACIIYKYVQEETRSGKERTKCRLHRMSSKNRFLRGRQSRPLPHVATVQEGNMLLFLLWRRVCRGLSKVYIKVGVWPGLTINNPRGFGLDPNLSNLDGGTTGYLLPFPPFHSVATSFLSTTIEQNKLQQLRP